MRATAAREDVPDLILDAADRLLARYGYKRMTMDDIAQEVGIGKGTIYLHFGSKEEIALARLRRMLVERVLFRFDSVQHYTESLSDVLAAIRPSLLIRHRRHFGEEAQVFAEVLREGRSGGEFVFKDAKATAEALLVATNALLPYSLSTRELGDRKDVESQVARIANLLLNGLKSAKT
jgi:AcrR family transcriptional regulator